MKKLWKINKLVVNIAILAMVRHGLSEFNKKNIFTGWLDVPLAAEGIEQAKQAAKLLNGQQFDIAYTSELKRAIDTLTIMMAEMKHPKIPIVKSQKLNERHYGKLQGLNKDEIRAKFGEEQFKLWRRSYSTRPPEGESLEDTAARALPFFFDKIVPDLDAGKNVLVSAHGNSIRAIVMKLDNLTHEEVVHLEIPYCVPLIYERTNKTFRKVKQRLSSL